MRKQPYLADANVIISAVSYLLEDEGEPIHQRRASWKLLTTGGVRLHGSDLVFSELADVIPDKESLRALRVVRHRLGKTLAAEEAWEPVVDLLMSRLRRTSANSILDTWHYVTACRYRQQALITWERRLSDPHSRDRIHQKSDGVVPRPWADIDTPEGVLGMPKTRNNPNRLSPVQTAIRKSRASLWAEAGGDIKRYMQLCRGRARALGMM